LVCLPLGVTLQLGSEQSGDARSGGDGRFGIKK
jgi:hypothetical protein